MTWLQFLRAYNEAKGRVSSRLLTEIASEAGQRRLHGFKDCYDPSTATDYTDLAMRLEAAQEPVCNPT